MRAEFQQNRIGRQILIVIALANEDVLDQAGVLLVGNRFDLLGERAVDLAVLVAAADEQAYLRGLLAFYGRLVLIRIGDAVPMDVDDGVRTLL